MVDNSGELKEGLAAATYDCSITLQTLYDVIMKRMTNGRHVSRFKHEERETEYQQTPMKELKQMYRIFYRQCGAQSGGLPDLSEAQERGGPAQVRVM